MHLSRAIATLTAVTAVTAAGQRFVAYYDKWHTAFPAMEQTANITHVVLAFAPSIFFTSDNPGVYQDLISTSSIRAMFQDPVKVCLSIGGWNDGPGYSIAYQTQESRDLFAKNVNYTLDQGDFDCVDIDWEYPGGNGADYIQNPNTGKLGEIAGYAELLSAVKTAIGDKELGIAVPGKEVDMIAFTAEQVPLINDAVDMVNVMAYDLMNRRDSITKHHTSVQGSNATIDRYVQLGMDPAKMNLGFAFYAKGFQTLGPCPDGLGCATALLEDAQGGDTGNSVVKTFYENPDVLAKGKPDTKEGGQWFWDSETNLFWTWDTPQFIEEKFEKIVKEYGLGGVSK